MNRLFFRSPWPVACLAGAMLAMLSLGGWMDAKATQLPAGVRGYLTQQDPQVKIRFDGLITFSDGETYLPVIPQAPKVPDALHVVRTYPAQVSSPDLIEFDNQYFLLRLVKTDKGRLTLPKLPEYPVSLLEGLLPQDLVLPPNLFIPVELKVILGALPYNPEFEGEAPATAAGKGTPEGKMPPVVKAQPNPPKAPQSAATKPPALPAEKKPVQEMLFVYNVNAQALAMIDPLTQRQQEALNLGCVPSRIRAAADGTRLFATCLTTDELLLVDTSAHLVKARLKVGSKPDDVLLLNGGKEALISHRFSKFVSLVDTQAMATPRELALPGASGSMALLSGNGQAQAVLVADAFAGKVYRLNLLQHVVDKTYDTLPDISAMQVVGNQLWLASRTRHQVQVLDLSSGQVLKTFEVGKKPVDMLVFGDRLYVLAAQADRLDVFDVKAKAAKEPIAFPAGTFPTGMVSGGAEKKQLYVLGAGTEGITLVNLEDGQTAGKMNLPVRGTLMTLAGGVLSNGTSGDTRPAAAADTLEMEAVSMDAEEVRENIATPPTQPALTPASATTRPVAEKAVPRDAEKNSPNLFPALPSLKENVLK